MFNYDEYREDLEQYVGECTKDLYHYWPGNLESLTVIQLGMEADLLSESVKAERIQLIADEKLAAASFEKDVTITIALGARDRVTAVRWLFDAEGADHGDLGYFQFCNGLSYDYNPYTGMIEPGCGHRYQPKWDNEAA